MSQQLTEQSATTALRLLVGTLARKTSKHRWGVPLWSVVGDLVGLGSTSATELVQSLGHNPFAMVLEPCWLDADQVAFNVCPSCQAIHDDPEQSGKCNECLRTGDL